MATTGSMTIAHTVIQGGLTRQQAEALNLPIAFDAAYKGDVLTKRVADILHLEDTHGWSVVDSEGELAMVHYTEEADMPIHSQLRGVLVDLEVGAIIADSFGYTPTAVLSELQPKEDKLSIMDANGDRHAFSLNDCVIRRVFEGVVIRVIWHKGRCISMTHRKINPQRSRWGSSKSFISMYQEAGGPTPEKLFDTTKPYSNTCYDFLVVDPSLLVGTRQKVTCPYLVFLAQRTMDLKRPAEEIAPGVASFTTMDVVGGSVTKPFILSPKQLTIAEANHHLQYGYYNAFTIDDPRQLTGEAVIIYRVTNGVVQDIVKVHSPAYDWRVTMRGNNPNIVNQFYALLGIAYQNLDSEETWATFQRRLILLPLYDEQSLKELFERSQGILTIPPGETMQEDYGTRDARIHLLWMNYVLSLPASLQSHALNILSQFKLDRNAVIAWLQNLEAANKDIETLDISNRVKGLIKSSRTLARQRVATGTNYSAKGVHMRLPILIKSTIRNLINKENGPSLYGLVRELREFNRPATAPVPTETQPVVAPTPVQGPIQLEAITPVAHGPIQLEAMAPITPVINDGLDTRTRDDLIAMGVYDLVSKT